MSWEKSNPQEEFWFFNLRVSGLRLKNSVGFVVRVSSSGTSSESETGSGISSDALPVVVAGTEGSQLLNWSAS